MNQWDEPIELPLHTPPALQRQTSQPPPTSGVHMPEVSAALGVAVDAVDAGGRDRVFSRPEEAVQPRGPIANSLDGRLSGSSAQVDAAGAGVTSAGDATVNERITP